jgi:imidazolonepropionase-like amidohydrolase
MVVALLLGSCSEQPPRADLALVGATLFDGSGAPPLTDAVVLVRRGRIAQVGRREDLPVTRETVTLDLSGKWIVPGLIDTHVHLPDSAGAERVLGALVRSGITAVRVAAGDLEVDTRLRERVTRGDLLGPRMKLAGRLMDAPGGIFAGWAAEVTDSLEVTNEIRAQLVSGADLVKVYRELPPDLVRVAVREAHAQGLSVLGHLGATTWTEAARDGIDGVSHFGPYGTPWELLPQTSWESVRRSVVDCRGDGAGFEALRRVDLSRSAEVAVLASVLTDHGVNVDPNLVLLRAVLWGDDPATRTWLNADPSGDAPSDSFMTALPHPYAAGCSPAWRAEARATFPWFLELFRELHARGVQMTIGTDLMNPWMTPGVSYQREMELWADAGISARAILLAATRTGGKALDPAHELGRVSAGYRADLVVLDADPLLDIANVARIDAVLHDGRIVFASEEGAVAAQLSRTNG